MNYKLLIREENKDIFIALKNGKKNVETRAATDKYRKIKPDDILLFICGKNKISKKVKKA